ncbi:MAG TPA: molybdate ABC transporter substrate-binding protein [Candidatus Paenibacillus intestinavium]|nr:molybdate ABC transporter substrate-binding protein [Candidatus Paenibacillus intestinavium]
MKKSLGRNKLIIVCAMLLIIMLAGCSVSNSQVIDTNLDSASNDAKISKQAASQKKEIVVSAAASISVVMDNIIAQFEAEHADIAVEVNYGSSGTLQKQIEQGAPVDLFVSAATKQMNALEEQGLLEAMLPLLNNEIVIVGNRELVDVALAESATIALLLKQVNPTFIAMGEPDSVPAGQYAKQVLQHEQLWDVWTKHYVYAKDVRQVLTYVEQGNAELGFVYLSDAMSSNKVNIIHHIDSATHDPITYPIAILKSSKQMDAAQLFFDYLLHEDRTVLYEQYGFKRAE